MYDISVREPSREGLQANLPLWLQPDFLAAVSELQGVEALQLVCRKGDQCVAMLPLYEKKSLGVRRLICPVSAYYQGFWYFWEPGREPNRNLLDELKVSSEAAAFLKARYKRMHFNLAPHNLDVRGFTTAGFKALPLYTFVHDLSQPLGLLADERKQLRTAEKQDYPLEESFRPDEFLSLLKELHQRKAQRFGLPYGAFQSWMETLHNKDLLAQFNLLQNGATVSSNLILGGREDSTGYSIMICTRPEAMKNGAATLHYKLLAEMLRDRFATLDFCGGNVVEVARFKAALGLGLKVFFQLRG